MKTTPLEWYVFYHDVNKKEICKFNIFRHCGFAEDVTKLLKTCADKPEFKKRLEKELIYYFWAKYEYEVVITTFPPYITQKEFERLCEETEREHPHRLWVSPETDKKIDIYNQVMLNFDVFADYVWSRKDENV